MKDHTIALNTPKNRLTELRTIFVHRIQREDHQYRSHYQLRVEWHTADIRSPTRIMYLIRIAHTAQKPTLDRLLLDFTPICNDFINSYRMESSIIPTPIFILNVRTSIRDKHSLRTVSPRKKKSSVPVSAQALTLPQHTGSETRPHYPPFQSCQRLTRHPGWR